MARNPCPTPGCKEGDSLSSEGARKKAVYIETLHRRGYRFVAAVRESAETGVVVPSQRSSTKMVRRERSRFSELREHLEKAIRGERQSVFITGVWRKCAKASVARPDWVAFVVFGTECGGTYSGHDHEKLLERHLKVEKAALTEDPAVIVEDFIRNHQRQAR